ncbi:hypothetical protein E2P81_ATG07436 [Venturia nashicola]|uniref:Uncharacterized protein n=1 Tax=Venturia nashicola TaxID=86259 RepID=A0A4Z1P6K2_9PEZI|nr:hypothetical protein E6O75_ATG07590 [Venturia nashicola]TLD31946.1 hypothetical protein E2P81_ATG07436 [Venturia nashicola]
MNNNPPPNLQEAESQWDEKEMTELAAEILQQRARLNPAEPTASQILFTAILGDPNFVTHQLSWEDLHLPQNRTIRSCRAILGSSRTPRHGSVSGYAQPGFAAPSPMINPAPYLPSASNKRQRPASAESAQALYPPSAGIRLAPKPSFAVGPSRPQGGSHPPSPLDNPPTTGSDPNPRKKRGRPSKKDVEERRAAAEKLAMERAPMAQLMQQMHGSPMMNTQPSIGPYPAQASYTGPREGPADTSASQSPLPAGVTATPRNTNQAECDVASSSSSSKKKRGRPLKVIDTGAVLPAPSFSTSGASSAGAYGSPPQSGVSVGSISRRLSVSTRSQGGTTAGPVQQEQGVQEPSGKDLGQQQKRQPRSWNDTVMGNSSNNANLRQPPQQESPQQQQQQQQQP